MNRVDESSKDYTNDLVSDFGVFGLRNDPIALDDNGSIGGEYLVGANV